MLYLSMASVNSIQLICPKSGTQNINVCLIYSCLVTGFEKNWLPNTIINTNMNYLKFLISEKKQMLACVQFTNWHHLVPFSAPYITLLYPWQTSPASCVVIDSWLSACPEEMESLNYNFKDHSALVDI